MGTNWSPDLDVYSGPKYLTVVQALRHAIASGQLPVGERLPPVRDLAWELKITPGTVARAYRLATDEGLLEAAVGRGTYVADRESKRAETEIAPIMLEETGGLIDLRGSKTPDVGQDADIQNVLAKMSSSRSTSYVGHPKSMQDYSARQAVCDWVTYSGISATPEDVTLTYGAQNSVMVAMQTILTGPAPVIAMDELVFPGMRHAARLLRAETVGIERDSEGIRPDKLEAACRREIPQVLLMSANVHNPTTETTTTQRRLEISDIAKRYNFQIVDDDAYGIFDNDQPSLRDISRGRVWYISSLSKSVAAGLRFGFMIAPRGKGSAARSVMQSSCYGMSQPVVDVCEELLTSGLAGEIRQRTLKVIRERVKTAVNTLGQWDIKWRPEVPFIWLTLPTGWRATSFVQACEQNGVLLRPSDEFALRNGKAPNAVRVAMNATHSMSEYETALLTISGLLSSPPERFDF